MLEPITTPKPITAAIVEVGASAASGSMTPSAWAAHGLRLRWSPLTIEKEGGANVQQNAAAVVKWSTSGTRNG
jgi:hypothetical protein